MTAKPYKPRKPYLPKVSWSLPEPEFTKAKAAQILSNTITTATGCMEWQGWLNHAGYAHVQLKNGRNEMAHRTVYRSVHGDIQRHMKVCHSCDNRKCCNPEHLWLGTQIDNIRDMDEKKRSKKYTIKACPKGHPYDDANTYVTTLGHRMCRTCTKANHRRPEYVEWRRNYQRKRRALKRQLRESAVQRSPANQGS